MQAVIMAGGKGTRLSSVTKNMIPKPMVPFCGKPLIEHLIILLADNGIKDIIICVGHLGEQIADYLGNGSRYGVVINYVREEIPLGTAGALCYAKKYIHSDFVLAYADLMMDIDFNRMYAFHLEKKADATLFVHPNSHPYDSDLVEHDDDFRVTGFDFKDHIRDYDYLNCVNAGTAVFSEKVLERFESPRKIALEKDVLQNMILEGMRVYAYKSPEYIKDVGTPGRLESAEKEFLSGKIHRRNLKNKQKAVFLDRDGTLNRFKGLITTPEQIELAETADTALKLLNESDYLALAVTNQPVVARGDCAESDVDAIHNRLYTLLGQKGAYLDDLVYCPHHTDKGFPGERPELKLDCVCRKPKTGMIDILKSRYNIDLSASWMVGDTYRDVQTGFNAGLKTILIPGDAPMEKERFNAEPDCIAKCLYDAVRIILE